GVDGGGAVRTHRLGDGRAVTADEHLDGVRDLAGLGQHLERDGSDAVLADLGVDPNLGKSHVFVPFERGSGQRTLRPSRNSTIFRWASPSSSMTSPASRSGAAATSTISWPAP